MLHTEWSNGWGGQEIRIINEMLAVREQGVEVFLACREHAVIRQKTEDQGIPVFCLPFKGNTDLKTLFGLRKIICKHNIDIVNTHSGKDTWVGGLAAKLAGAKFIRTRHLSNRLRSSRLNFINEWADYIFTTGESIRQDMIQYNRIKPDRIQSIPTGIDSDIFDPEKYDRHSCRERYNIQENEIAIGIVAVLRQFKRHDLFVDSAKKLIAQFPDTKFNFLIAGDGPRKHVIENEIAAQGLQNKIKLLGHVSNVPELLAALDLFVLTSDSKEGVPQSVMQALLMNNAVVSTDVGSTRDLYRDNFILVNPNVEEISNGLSELILDPDRRNALASNARSSIIDSFSKTSMTHKIIQVYRKLLHIDNDLHKPE